MIIVVVAAAIFGISKLVESSKPVTHTATVSRIGTIPGTSNGNGTIVFEAKEDTGGGGYVIWTVSCDWQSAAQCALVAVGDTISFDFANRSATNIHRV